MPLSSCSASRTGGRWVAGLALLGLLAACRPPGPPRAVGRTSDPPPVLNAPAQPPEARLDLDAYVLDLLQALSAKRFGRHITAAEPLEAASSVVPLIPASRLYATADPIEAQFRAGEELFEMELSLFPAFGDALGGPSPNMHRVHRGAHGGPDTSSCRSCHHRGGDDGAGEYTEAALTGGDGEHPASANERNPPPLHGGGLLQILAREITDEFQARIRHPPLKYQQTIQLVVQGVDFGAVHLMPDGQLETSELTAIDDDLVVRPFGWKGTHSTLRRFAEEAFQVHHGLQSNALMQLKDFYGPLPRDASPATRAVIAALGDGPPENPDRDSRRVELSGAQLTAMATYLSLLPIPAIEPPRSPELLAAWREGMATFDEIGCASCHKPVWYIKEPIWREISEDDTSEVRLTFDLRKDIRNGPPLRQFETSETRYAIYPFSDLRRHDMGPELADDTHGHVAAAKPDGSSNVYRLGPNIPESYFLTRPLWGLADSAPYLHDGRAPTLHDAIVLHGGEASVARDAYKQLPLPRQRALQVFLFSLSRPLLPEVTP